MSTQPILSDKEIKKKMKPKFEKDYKKFYPIKKLEELGFIRSICTHCGQGFWSIDSSRETCDEAICSGGYKFINSPLTKKKLGYKEAWDRYVDIFAQWNYVPIDRYPVVARWYDELYFTTAGINVFQPFIVSGSQKPPHQAVLEPQISLRFNDIDNVGITGTHYTAFIMVGQHVFNSDQLGNLYWMTEGIEQIYTFLIDGLTIPKNQIVFHEDIWAGGGNFGPSIEFFAGGIELGNQVYIQYDSATFQQLDTRVIDMGAGLERWAWFTQGVATSYETTFPQVMNYLYTTTGFKPEKDVWNRFMRYAGQLNVDETENIRQAWVNVAQNLNMTLEELRKLILPIRALYAIADHSRNLLFAIRDGALPSNVGGGYNLRNILRRCYSLIDEYNFTLDFHKIFETHSQELGNWFPELKEFGSLFDILDLEKKRYAETKSRNLKKIQRLVKSKKEIPFKELLKLYDSTGITPEMIHQVDPNIQTPEDFYMKVQELHEKRRLEERSKPFESIVPYTRQLFYEDSYASKESFEATILDIVKESWLILDQTHFFPEGGGQVADTGMINNIQVLDTQKDNNRIFHRVTDPSTFSVGQKVNGQIDWKRRYTLMKLHSATHLVNWAAKEILGPHIWQAGARKTPEYASLDITHYKSLSLEEIQQIESLVNYAIIEKPVISTIKTHPRTDAEQKFGMEIYQGGAIPATNLRIVSWNDDEACSGTHLQTSQEIGFLKITKTERIQDGIVRLEYVIGEKAIKRTQYYESIIKKMVDKWKVSSADLLKEAEKITSEWLEQGKELTQLREKMILLGLGRIFNLKENQIWVQSSIKDIRLLSSVFARFLEENRQILYEIPKTIFILTLSKKELLAASTESGMNLEEELLTYCDIVKMSKRKKKMEPNDVILYYQGFKLKTDIIGRIHPSITI
ncbi:MAG: alanine--tRNA ligase [Candidatus Hodarchaeales archaeon]|jgi:alanyl-tRNA synthetase